MGGPSLSRDTMFGETIMSQHTISDQLKCLT